MTTAVDTAEEADAAEAVAAAEEAAADSADAVAAADTADHAKCTKRLAPIADKNAKCLSSQAETGLYTAETVSRSTRNTRNRI